MWGWNASVRGPEWLMQGTLFLNDHSSQMKAEDPLPRSSLFICPEQCARWFIPHTVRFFPLCVDMCMVYMCMWYTIPVMGIDWGRLVYALEKMAGVLYLEKGCMCVVRSED